MPDGRPGDHPLSDIAVHGVEMFDAETNARIRRLVNGAPPPLIMLLNEAIWNWPRVDPTAGLWGAVVNPTGFKSLIEGIETCWRDMAKRKT